MVKVRGIRELELIEIHRRLWWNLELYCNTHRAQMNLGPHVQPVGRRKRFAQTQKADCAAQDFPPIKSPVKDPWQPTRLLSGHETTFDNPLSVEILRIIRSDFSSNTGVWAYQPTRRY